MSRITPETAMTERLRRLLRASWRAPIMFSAIVTFMVHGLALQLMIREPLRRRQLLIENVTRYSRFALALVGVYIETNAAASEVQENFLYVGNHLSYLDMLVLASIRPSVFVTSVDMGQVPFLGRMAEVGGSLFIERRHRERLGFDVAQVQRVLNDGFDVTLFPEGTSTNGDAVLPFKRGLLPSAQLAAKKLRPFSLRYERIDGREFSKINRDKVCWYGDMPFASHFFSLMQTASIEASVTYHAPQNFGEDDTKEIVAVRCHQSVQRGYEQSKLSHKGFNDAHPQRPSEEPLRS